MSKKIEMFQDKESLILAIHFYLKNENAIDSGKVVGRRILEILEQEENKNCSIYEIWQKLYFEMGLLKQSSEQLRLQAIKATNPTVRKKLRQEGKLIYREALLLSKIQYALLDNRYFNEV